MGSTPPGALLTLLLLLHFSELMNDKNDGEKKNENDEVLNFHVVINGVEDGVEH